MDYSKQYEKMNSFKIADSFEDYLEEQHVEIYPTLLDDDIPDHFSDWLGSLDVEDLITYADEYADQIRKQI